MQTVFTEWGGGGLCADVDECLLQTTCVGQGSTCVNEAGGYRCACHNGYLLTAAGQPCTGTAVGGGVSAFVKQTNSTGTPVGGDVSLR